jgi:hypothetical protein
MPVSGQRKHAQAKAYATKCGIIMRAVFALNENAFT